MKIISLSPSATEIISDLKLLSYLRGISHECNYPFSVRKLPKISSSTINKNKTQIEIEEIISKAVKEKKSLYKINTKLIQSIKPDYIITQGICEVCSVSKNQIEIIYKNTNFNIPSTTKIISLNATNFKEICNDVFKIAKCFDVLPNAIKIINHAKKKIKTLKSKKQFKQKVLLLEWIEPLYSAGHWMPEQIEMAGFQCAIGKKGIKSTIIDTKMISESNPDFIAITCCGFNLNENREAAKKFLDNIITKNSIQIMKNKIFVFDADRYFSRPTLNIVEGAIQLRNAFLKLDKNYLYF